MQQRGRGVITTTYEAVCGRCFVSATTRGHRNRSDATRHFVGEGWLHTRTRGWVCPECAKIGDPRRDNREGQ